VLVAVATTALLALPGSASAADTYADASAPDNSGDCLSPASACQTIGGLDGALSKSGPGDTTFVADGTYAETVVLGDGKSLMALDGTDPRPVIDGGSAGSAVEVDVSGAGAVSGFELLSEIHAMDVSGTVTIQGNLFDSPTASSQTHVEIEGAEDVVVDDNEFSDPDASGVQLGLTTVNADGSGPEISDNTFEGLVGGVVVFGGTPEISDNEFSAMRPPGISGMYGAGVVVFGGAPAIVHNAISDAAGPAPTAGVFITDGSPNAAGAILSRNRISNSGVGVRVVDASGPVTMSNDLIYDNLTGVESTDRSADDPDPTTNGDVAATNATIYGNAVDLQLSYTTATLDSVILGQPIDLVGDGACSITYSHGPSGASANGCGNFATTADPQFADPDSGDFRLRPTSPLIDIGNPASVTPGALDFYGSLRAVQGKACSPARRDIGAAEYDPGTTPQCIPPAPPSAPAATTQPSDRPERPRIEKRPPRRSSERTATFEFSSETPGVRFRCRIDIKPWRRCHSPVTYRGLRRGKHTFRVQAISISPDGTRSRIRTVRFWVLPSQ
jgi:hypothetical protein